MITSFIGSGTITSVEDLNYAKGSGLPYVRFNVGVTETYATKNGLKTNVHNVSLFAYNKIALVAKDLKVGDEVIMEMQMSTREYKEKCYLDLKLKGIAYINGKVPVLSGEEAKAAEKMDEEAPF